MFPKGIEIEQGEMKQAQTEICSHEDEEWIPLENTDSGLGLDHELVDFSGFDDLYMDVISPPFQSCEEEIKNLVNSEAENVKIVKSEKEKPYSASLEILNKYGNRLKRLHSENLNLSSSPMEEYSKENQQKGLSIPAILRLAGEMFIQSVSSKHIELSKEDTKNLRLLQYLLSAAEKVGEKQFHTAGKLLKKCDKLRYQKGNGIQRLVYYFSAALHERIDRQTKKSAAEKGVGKNLSLYIENILSSTSSAMIAFQKAVPFCHVCQFSGMQAIIEQVSDSRKIHIIDLQIRMGTQYTLLMQALAARDEFPVEYLKITAVGIHCKAAIEETGKRLTSFSETFNLTFSFSIVMIDDVKDLKKDHFKLDEENEAVAVYAEFILMLLVDNPSSLESLMRVIRGMNPSAMVVIEGEVNQNSPVFVDRFAEALFYYGAFFDALADCLNDDDDSPNRLVFESMFFSRGIKNVVAIEGEERTIRHVKVKVWRDFFAKFGMAEVQLSMSSKYQAKLILNNFACGNSCTLDMDGESLIIGWKGIPTQSLSVWKFK